MESHISKDMTLTAVYEEIEKKEELNLTSFSLEEQETTVSFDVEGSFTTAAEVKNNIKVLPKDGSDPVKTEVQENGDNGFTVYAPDGFEEGSTYELTLNEGLNFVGKDDMFRTAYFIIKKPQVDNLKYNEDLKFIQDTEEMQYTINGKTQDVLEAALLSNTENKETISGTFNMTGEALTVGDVICIFESVDPRERDYTQNNYEDDELAYVRITSVEGDIYGFESINEEDYDQVLTMPDTIPFQVQELPTANGTISKTDYDVEARTLMGQGEAPKFKVDDFLVFYNKSFLVIKEGDPVVYGQITMVEGDQISYNIIDKSEIESFMGMFVKQEVDGNELLKEIDEEKVLNDVKTQAEESGFTENAAEHMVRSALATTDIQQKLRGAGITTSEIDALIENPNLLTAGGAGGTGGSGGTGGTGGSGGTGKTKVVVEGISVVPELIHGKRFKNGIGVNLQITFTLSIDKRTTLTKMSSLKIDLSAGLEQELAFGFDVNVDDIWKWYGIIPILDDLHVNVSVDIQSYSSVSVGAKMYTVSEDVQKKWKALSGQYANPKISEYIRKMNVLAAKAKRLRARGEGIDEILEQIKDYKEQIKDYKEQLPKVTVDRTEYSIEQLEEALGGEDVSEAFDEVFSAKGEIEHKTGLDQLMDRYKEMIDQECDWVELVNQKLFEKEFHIKIVAIKVGVNFIIRGKVNVAIGADLEYQVGKRYSFWLHLKDRTSGSNEIDLIDERFGFQFYVMGELGLKIGIKAELGVGIISTSIGSVGDNVEFGPYLKIYGYFVYFYEKLRPKNTTTWNKTEEMLGALYVNFGLYVTVKFKAQVFQNTFKYEPTLYDLELPLLIVGERQNVYDFAQPPKKGEVLNVFDMDSNSRNGITMRLPNAYRNMKTMDMCTGEKKQVVYPVDKFAYTFTNSKFTIDKDGVIHVDVPEDTRYMKSDLRVVWKCDKVVFSKYDTDITIPVVWSNYTEQEKTEKLTASVMVGGKIVWSEQYTRLDTFDLPTQEQILELIDYDKYESTTGNLKYASVKGYEQNATNLSISSDTIYQFEVAPKIYKLTVSGVRKLDGTTEERSYEADYGQSFPLDGLRQTRKNNPDKQEYTIFNNITDSKGEVFNQNTTVDLAYVEKYGTDATVSANYLNNTYTATFHFVGIGEQTPVEKVFKKGTTPYFEGITAYVKELANREDVVARISPEFGPLENDASFIVNCTYENVPSYNVSYIQGKGLKTKVDKVTEGASINNLQPDLCQGYSFGGWYSDESCTSPFDFKQKMPGEDIAIYAKWIPLSITVNFIPGDKYSVIGSSSKEVAYDTAYGELPVCQDSSMKFLGWFTQEKGGTKRWYENKVNGSCKYSASV